MIGEHINTITTHQEPTASQHQNEQLKSNHYNKLTNGSSTVDQMYRNTGHKVCVVDEQMKHCIQILEESIKTMEIKVKNSLQKATDVQKNNEELQTSNTSIQNQLSLTQQKVQRNDEQLQVISKELQANNKHLLSQLSIILDKLSHTQQQLLDMQKSNEQLQVTNTQLIDQLSLTQQQLLGVQSMMTCSRLWVVSHDQFTIGKEIGRGAWATVHEATFRGTTVAAKRLYDMITSPDYVELFHREMQMALLCQHRNIVTFLGVTLEDHPVILMELMDGCLRDTYPRGDIKMSSSGWNSL